MHKSDASLDLLVQTQDILRQCVADLDRTSDSLTGAPDELTQMRGLFNYAKSIRFLASFNRKAPNEPGSD